MSGGVGPPCDITLPKPELQEPEASTAAGQKTTKKLPTRLSLFTFRQLNALVVAIVLSASGMVTADNLAFVVFSIFYMYFISKVAFPPTPTHTDPPLSGEKSLILSLYSFVGAVIGLFLPVAYIFEGIIEGDREGIKAAAPHVFLLASQVFLEGLCSTSGWFSAPMRVLVPVIFNAMRILSIVEWLRSEISKVAEVGYEGSERRLYVGKALAVANMAFWTFNLFCFLLPFYLPKAFKMYYSNNKCKD